VVDEGNDGAFEPGESFGGLMFGPGSAEVAEVGGNRSDLECVLAGVDDGDVIGCVFGDETSDLSVKIVDGVSR